MKLIARGRSSLRRCLEEDLVGPYDVHKRIRAPDHDHHSQRKLAAGGSATALTCHILHAENIAYFLFGNNDKLAADPANVPVHRTAT